MIDFIDLFAGVGGFHLGLTGKQDIGSKPNLSQGWNENGGGAQSLQPEGSQPSYEESNNDTRFRCVWANEWDKYAAQTYRKNFPETPLSTDDIRSVEADCIPDHDLLCAGFPCQAFSVAGKRRGLEEARGTLFYEIARVAERKRPRLLLLENVKGLLSHDEGRTFATILRVMGSIGYRLEWQVFNSKWFGVPQNRERVFIIGHLGEEPTRTIFPITEIDRGFTESCRETQREGQRIRVANSLSGFDKSGLGGFARNLIANTLSHRYGKDGSENLLAISSTNPRLPRGHHKYHLADSVRTIPSSNAGNNNPMIYDAYNHTPRPEIGAIKTNESSPTSSSNLIGTIMEHDRSALASDNLIEIQGQRIRRLTPLECERLQGFPDGWTEGVSDTQRYKQLGNAVTVNVIRFLGQSILASEGEHK